MSRINIMGVGFDPLSPKEALDRFVQILDNKKTSYVVTPNPEMLIDSSKNLDLREALNSADMVIADGIGVVYAAKILKKPLKQRVTGIGLMSDALGFLADTRGSYFLFGSKPGVAEFAAKNIDKKYVGVNCAGCQHGYFKKEDEEGIVKKINDSKCDVVFVGLGSPKQELWVYENIKNLNSTVCMCIGGAIDVFAGNVKRAPKWVQKIGFEWLFRAIKEPKRFKRLLKLPAFMVKVFASKNKN